MKPKSHTKPARRDIRVAKQSSAAEAIGEIRPNTDTFILTYGQFSLIDALVAILDQTGPADVIISTWTAADAHLQRSAALLESAQIRSLRWIVDRSFETRQPEYCYHMRKLFGPGCIRAIRTHAKFMVVRSETHDIVVRTSMNLNENPRLENLEVSWDSGMADFFQTIADDIFKEVAEGENKLDMPELTGAQETFNFEEIEADIIKREDLNECKTTHVVSRTS